MISQILMEVFLFLLVASAIVGDPTVCSPNNITHVQCNDTQVCDEYSKTCLCRPGLMKLNETFCAKEQLPNATNSNTTTPNSSSLVASRGSGSIFVGILIPLFLLLFLIYGVYLGRKYDFLRWIRIKIQQRRNNYDEFMIGNDLDGEDDDPPLR